MRAAAIVATVLAAACGERTLDHADAGPAPMTCAPACIVDDAGTAQVACLAPDGTADCTNRGLLFHSECDAYDCVGDPLYPACVLGPRSARALCVVGP